MNQPTISDSGVNLIVSFEGFRGTPYQDSKGIWTIGYGSTYLLDGSRVTQTTPPMTSRDAFLLLKKHIQGNELSMRVAIKYPCTQNQWDALCSFVYNVGIGNFKTSTLLKKLNAGDTEGCAREFMKWIAKGTPSEKGLTRRRLAEQKLFLS